MPTVMDALAWVLQLPAWLAIPALFAIVLARSHATYWLGRAAAGGTSELMRVTAARAQPVAEGAAPRTRWQRAAARVRSSPATHRAMTMVRRWGALAVTGAYFTVGVQSAIFGAAGLIRMPYPRFALASIPGSAGWALMWFGVGAGAWWAVGRLAGSTTWLVAVLATAVTAIAVALHRRRRASHEPVEVP